MLSTKTPSVVRTPPELIWVGDGGWVACDATMPDGDRRRVIAYLECKNKHVYVLWAHDRTEVCCYDTLRDALQEVASAMTRDVVEDTR